MDFMYERDALLYAMQQLGYLSETKISPVERKRAKDAKKALARIYNRQYSKEKCPKQYKDQKPLFLGGDHGGLYWERKDDI